MAKCRLIDVINCNSLFQSLASVISSDSLTITEPCRLIYVRRSRPGVAVVRVSKRKQDRGVLLYFGTLNKAKQ